LMAKVQVLIAIAEKHLEEKVSLRPFYLQ